MGWPKKVAFTVAAGGLAVGGVLLARALAPAPDAVAVAPSTLPVDGPAVAGRLAQAIRIRTVSGEQRDPATFDALHAWMVETWPAIHAATTRETVARHSLLYTWAGTDPALPPVVVMAHQDVVPVEAGTEAGWGQPPFSGAIAPCGDRPGDCVWGRGAMDMKATMVGLFDAAEGLAASGWRPRRTLLFVLGEDEEVSGAGARAVVDRLSARGVRPAWVLDEGLVIADGIVPGLDRPAALVGVAEKGFVSVEIVARSEGGHSSMPPTGTAAGRVGRAVARLEARPFALALDGPAERMFASLGPHMAFGNKLAFANLWLLGGVVEGKLAAKNSTRATLHTTQAVTMLEGSPQDNVLPQQARAVVNFRIHPRDSVEGVLAHVRDAIDDPDLEVRQRPDSLFSEPSPVSPSEGAAYDAIAASIRAAVPDAVVAPGLMVGATDSRSFAALTDHIYRFQPLWLRPGDSERIHGTGERVAVDNLVQVVRFHDAHLRRAGE
jgi:carboxypeptidase PM20D1